MASGDERPVLPGPLSFPLIRKPQGDTRLAGFSTGTKEKWERDVNELVDFHYKIGMQGWPRLKIMAMMSAADEVLGVCGWHPKQPGFTPPGKQMTEPPPYIRFIGIAEGFRKRNSEAGVTLGDELLVGALKRIALQWPSKAMPAVWALVDPKNKDSHNLFERHGFRMIEKEVGDHRQYRPYDLELF
jgi:hypothetical protein